MKIDEKTMKSMKIDDKRQKQEEEARASPPKDVKAQLVAVMSDAHYR